MPRYWWIAYLIVYAFLVFVLGTSSVVSLFGFFLWALIVVVVHSIIIWKRTHAR